MTFEKLITNHIDIWSSSLQTRSTAGRGSNGKIDLYGIKKLRELILELAVRGKLVPQDPNDEPASLLLKRIAAEKAELVKQGKIKKQKPLPEISEDEKPFELPKGWEWCRLGDLAYNSEAGWSPQCEAAPRVDDNWGVLKISSVTWGEFAPEENKALPKHLEPKIEYEVKARDFLISRANTADLVARSVVVPESLPKHLMLSDKIIRFQFSILIDANYINLFNNAGYSRSYYSDVAGGTSSSMKNVSRLQVSSLLIGLPTYKEQLRIVYKARDLMSLCDQLEQRSLTSLEAHQQLVETLLTTLADSQNAKELAENWARISQHFDTLFTTEASIDALKQTILQLAVMGKLVPQDPNDEPASELLKRIEQEKAQLVKEGKIKKQKPLPPVSDEEKPFVLPMGWEWCRLGDLALGSEAGWSPQCESHPRNGDDWGVLKISAVTWGEFNAEENKALPVKLEPKQEYEVKGNDFLLSRANTSELVARSVVVPQTVPKHLMLSDKIIRFQFPDLIDVNYINIVNNSMLSREYYGIVAGGTSASMKNVTRNQVSLLPVALPPYNEIKKIISVIESVLVLVDTLKNLVVKSEGIKKNLTDSIIFHFEN